MRIVIALLLTLSVAFARVGESDAQFQKRFDAPPDKIEKFDNGVIRYSFNSPNGRPRVIAFSVKGVIVRVEYRDVSKITAESLRKAQEKSWNGLVMGRWERWISDSGLRADFTARAFIITDPQYDALLDESAKQRPTATVVPG